MHVFYFCSRPETVRPDRVEADESLYFIMEGKRNDQHGFQLLRGKQDFVCICFGGQLGNVAQHDVAFGFDGVDNPRDRVVCQLVAVVFRDFYP